MWWRQKNLFLTIFTWKIALELVSEILVPHFSARKKQRNLSPGAQSGRGLASKVLISNSLMGSFGRGHCRKFSANFRKLSAEFPHPFLTQSNVFLANFGELSAEFPQTFRKNPSLMTP